MKKGIALLFLLSGMAHAQVMDEVITLKDGTVLQGEIVEQSFVRGTYTVQLNSGGLVEVDKKQVRSISRVKSQNPYRSANNQNVETLNRNREHIDFNKLPATSAGVTISPKSKEKSNYPESIYRIGPSLKSIVDSDGYGESYLGVKTEFQANFNEMLGYYISFYGGRLSDSSVELPDGGSSSIGGAELAVLFANKFTRGFQYFGGVGVFQEKIKYTSAARDDIEATGYSLQAGLGYNWKSFQITYRGSFDQSADHGNNVGLTSNVQLGYAFW